VNQVHPSAPSEGKVARWRRGAGALGGLPHTELDPPGWRLRDLGDQNTGEPLRSGECWERVDAARRECGNQNHSRFHAQRFGDHATPDDCAAASTWAT
jgi:hypothetical protein